MVQELDDNSGIDMVSFAYENISDDGDFVFAQTAYKFDVFSYSMILISRKQSQIIMDL